jgi:hypothetical protein
MAKAICPACRRSLDLDRHVKEGEFLSCPACDAVLELISLHPLALDWVDDGFDAVGMTRQWQGSAKRSSRDKKKGTKARISGYREFEHVDF